MTAGERDRKIPIVNVLDHALDLALEFPRHGAIMELYAPGLFWNSV